MRSSTCTVIKMKICRMSLLLLGLFDNMLAGSSVIPTQEEQANLLTNVQEVFEQVKLLVNVEANSTDESVVYDINRIVRRAEDKLALLEELSLTKMSCGSNAVCMLEFRQIIQNLTQEGIDALQTCVEQSSADITMSSSILKNSTEKAIQSGQNLLDTLHNCSRKSGLQIINCYKDVIAKDVVPVKMMQLSVIKAHKKGHFRTIEIRNVANDCIDHILERYQAEIESVLNKGLHCT